MKRVKTKGKINVSLPEIGGYTDSEIFVKKKSKKMFSFLCRPHIGLGVFIPWALAIF